MRITTFSESDGSPDATTSLPQWKNVSLRLKIKISHQQNVLFEASLAVAIELLEAHFVSFRMIGQSGWSSMEEIISAVTQAKKFAYTKWAKVAGAVRTLSHSPPSGMLLCSVSTRGASCSLLNLFVLYVLWIGQPRKSGNISAKKLMAGPDTVSVEPPSAQFVAAPLSFTCQQVWDRTNRRAHLGKSIGQGPPSHGNRLMQPFSDKTRGCFHSYACVTASCQEQEGFLQ